MAASKCCSHETNAQFSCAPLNRYHLLEYVGKFNAPKSKTLFGNINATHIRINGTFQMTSVEVFGGCEQLTAGTTAPALKGNRLAPAAVPKGQFANPQAKVKAKQQLDVDAEGDDYDITAMKGSQSADVDQRDQTEKPDTQPNVNEGRVGKQHAGDLFFVGS